MESTLFQNIKYKELIQQYLIDTIALLFDENKNFSIVCEVEYIEFDPYLPHDIYAQFGKNVLFSLVGYTYESAKLEEDYLIFEAGFGKDNFGAVVAMPVLAIKQIIVDETPIAINGAMPMLHIEEESNDGVQSSMSILLNNPENQKLLKQRKK
ncbi:MAG: hypothetical protein JXQ76_04490 [Campylobacterales bacterium]|nr:hypothetical protein [Campylobacterales bacterium]